jgi:hypothetical protein
MGTTYRLLKDNETIKVGDEMYYLEANEWLKVTKEDKNTINKKAIEFIERAYLIRRPVSTKGAP